MDLALLLTRDRNFYRQILRLTGFIAMQNVIACFVGLADNVMIGAYSQDALSGVALANQVLSALGKPVLPIESETVQQLVTAGITTVTALVAWWKNNSFTPAALEADKTFDRLKAQGVELSGKETIK